MKKDERGITLIVLTIMITLGLILISVGIKFAIDGSLFTKTTAVVSKSNEEEIKQKEMENTANVEVFETPGKGIKSATQNLIIKIKESSLQSKTVNSITVRAKASNLRNHNMIYELYVSTTENGTYTKKATSVSTESNKAVDLTAENLSEYTTYYWYVDVIDEDIDAETQKQSTRTYCSGHTYLCQGTSVVQCSTCSGTGSVTTRCPGSTSYKTCTTCSRNWKGILW